MEELKEFIYNDLNDDWFNQSNANAIYKVALTLLDKGLTIQEIKNCIYSIYTATSDEYGN